MLDLQSNATGPWQYGGQGTRLRLLHKRHPLIRFRTTLSAFGSFFGLGHPGIEIGPGIFTLDHRQVLMCGAEADRAARFSPPCRSSMSIPVSADHVAVR
jgi:hypothetical protein